MFGSINAAAHLHHSTGLGSLGLFVVMPGLRLCSGLDGSSGVALQYMKAKRHFGEIFLNSVTFSRQL